jgi:hypothetical protein
MLNVVMLSVVMQSAIMLRVMAPTPGAHLVSSSVKWQVDEMTLHHQQTRVHVGFALIVSYWIF